jgi:hypothetical protein
LFEDILVASGPESTLRVSSGQESGMHGTVLYNSELPHQDAVESRRGLCHGLRNERRSTTRADERKRSLGFPSSSLLMCMRRVEKEGLVESTVCTYIAGGSGKLTRAPLHR